MYFIEHKLEGMEGGNERCSSVREFVKKDGRTLKEL
jgi:hypothetical protein